MLPDVQSHVEREVRPQHTSPAYVTQRVPPIRGAKRIFWDAQVLGLYARRYTEHADRGTRPQHVGPLLIIKTPPDSRAKKPLRDARDPGPGLLIDVQRTLIERFGLSVLSLVWSRGFPIRGAKRLTLGCSGPQICSRICRAR